MSNYALQSELSRLEGELRDLQRYNAQLRGELSSVTSGVERANRELVSYNEHLRDTLESCNGSMHSSHRQVVDAIALQGEIERLYERFKNAELASKKIRAANNRKYYEFADYRTVRKIVRGMMDNLDVQMVSDSTIMKSVETQHLRTPDYWLTCVLISIMAWRNDDRELAERAVDRAVRLDRKSSSVFYMLFNLRMGRETAALKWFRSYQSCELKGSDERSFLMLFSLVSKTMADEVDVRTKNEIFSFIDRVIEMNRQAAGYSEEELVDRIRRRFDRMLPSDQLSFAMLKKCCAEYDELASVLMQAKNNANILEFILQTLNVPPEEKNRFLKEYIDELIAAPNRAEKELYDEIALNERILRLRGDVETARAQFAAEKEKKEQDLRLIDEMIDWIYKQDGGEINGQIRRSMFILTKTLQEKAVTAHAEAYRSRRRTSFDVCIDDYRTQTDFGQEAQEQKKLAGFFAAKRDEELKKLKTWPACVCFGLGALALAGCFFAGAWLLALALAAVGCGVYTLLSGKAERGRIEQRCAERAKAASEQLRQLFAEYARYEKEFEEYDAYYDRILETLGEI